jgi:hypothetical protein
MYKDKAFINNIYHSVSLEVLEEYLYKITYPLLKDVVDEVGKNMSVREEDKKFIADFYKYAFRGRSPQLGQGRNEGRPPCYRRKNLDSH